MKELKAAELRQSLSKIADGLRQDGEPILLKLGNEPVGVLVSMQDFHERFAVERAAAERFALLEEILGDTRPGAAPVDEVVSELRER